MLEFVRDGLTLEQVTENGKKMLGKDLVQSGIDKMLTQIIIEANFRSSGQKTIIIENPICSQESDLNLLFHGSFLPIPNKDILKSNQKSNSDEYVMIDVDQKTIEHEADSMYPGKVIAYECAKSDSLKQESRLLDTNQNNNEEGELKDEDENSGEKSEDIKMLTSDSSDQKTSKLTEKIFLNKNKNPSDCILLTVHNLSKQTIKVNIFSKYIFI